MRIRMIERLEVGAARARRGAIVEVVITAALIICVCFAPVAQAYPEPGTAAITACQAIRGYHRDGVSLSQINTENEAQSLLQSHQGNAVISLGEARHLIKRAVDSYYLGTDDMCS